MIIREVFDRFLEAQEQRLKPRTYSDYESVIELFARCLQWYGWNTLPEEESDKYKEYEKEGKEFADVYGHERIDIDPPIWRRFQVTSDRTLHRLHLILQAVMGWDNYHLYEFIVDDVPYGEPDDEYEPDKKQARGYKLNEVIHSEGQRITYVYDYGDNWEHEILVEQIRRREPDDLYPVCLAGERACPPEDCGGVTGYENLLEILRDPEHEEHEDTVQWARRDGRDYEPEDCNLKSINRELRYHWQKRRRPVLSQSILPVIIRGYQAFIQ